jgi:apolipoprotein N-acyltransferase
MNRIIDYIKNQPSISCFSAGLLSGLIFAPTFVLPFIFTLSILAYHSLNAVSIKQAFMHGFYFGFGHFLVGLYWVTFALFVYIDEFWWAIPFALFGLPLLMAIFIASASAIANLFKSSKFFNLYFTISWIFFEWLRSWLFTGLPWNLIGYSLSFSVSLIQLASIVGVLGLSLIVVYLSIGLVYLLNSEMILLKKHIILTIIASLAIYAFGEWRLQNNPTEFTDTSVRLVQPSIPQIQKWDINEFINGIKSHIELSTHKSDAPDLIIWSESALPTLINNPDLLKTISSFLTPTQTLLTGAVGETFKDNASISHVGMYGINSLGNITAKYEKIHLVPFGEYIPFKSFLPIKKLTHGLTDYSPGLGGEIILKGLKIRPLICYEVIFPEEIKAKSTLVNLMINISNDAWYGKSSGPYQHFYTTQMRSVENGIPILRTANSGISAVIDPVGRVLKRTKLNAITYIDSYIPKQLSGNTIYSSCSQPMIMFSLIFIVIIAELVKLKWIRI